MAIRDKYPIFRYKSYKYSFEKGNLKISFDFLIEPDIAFSPKIIIENVKEHKDKQTLENLIFNLGMIEMVSYLKAACSQNIIIDCGYLDTKQKKFWRNLFLNGLGEFFYENKIDFREKDFFKFKTNKGENLKVKKIKTEDKILLPIGGGKDSIVSLNLLKKENLCLMGLNPTKEIKATIGGKKHIYIKREIDKRLLELRQKGFYNGHTPFSAYLAFLSTLCAFLTNSRYIALSNESSANEETVCYLGKKINHQYSKTLEFENSFREYAKEYIANGIEYFSFLRPLYEIQIAKLFSNFKKYHSIFLSCNEANKTYSGTRKKTQVWCGHCPKCLFVFSILYPFMKEQDLSKIFKKNLFEDKSLQNEMLKLIGEGKSKPFECIGEKQESLIAFYLSSKKAPHKYCLLDYLEKNIFPKYKNLDALSKKIMNAWNEKNNLPPKFKKILKNEIRKS